MDKKIHIFKFPVHARVHTKKLLNITIKNKLVKCTFVVKIGYKFGPNFVYVYCGVLFGHSNIMS